MATLKQAQKKSANSIPKRGVVKVKLAKPKDTKKSYARGGSKHYRDLAMKSQQKRIKRNIHVEFKNEGGEKPWRKRDTDAGYDLFAGEDVILSPKTETKVQTNVRIKCPPGYWYRIEGRSSSLRLGLRARQNVIDATYSGPISVWMWNQNTKAYQIKKGDRVAQIIFYPQIHVTFDEVTEFSEDKQDRGELGYGSSGR